MRDAPGCISSGRRRLRGVWHSDRRPPARGAARIGGSRSRQRRVVRPTLRGLAITASAVSAEGELPRSPLGTRAVLQIKPFRRLFYTLVASSTGDWLSLLATIALAAQLPGLSSTEQSFALSGALILKMLPALVLGPFAGAFADRWDRRTVMVVTDIGRFAVFVSIPIVLRFGPPSVGVTWFLIATFLVEALTVFWIPAKEASIPNLVPKEQIETANQLNLLTAYGTAPFAAVLFIALSAVATLIGKIWPSFDVNDRGQTDLAFYFNGVSFLVSAIVVYSLHELGGNRAVRTDTKASGGTPPAPVVPATSADEATREEATSEAPPRQNNVLADIAEGWSYARHSPVIRGLVLGMVGAFAAGGIVMGLAKDYVALLGGGANAFGVLFAFVFIGLAVGMYVGPRLLRDLSRRRLFGLAIVGAGLSLSIVSLLPNVVLVDVAALLLGSFAGTAWVTGYTLIGSEVADEIRGRTWALIQSLVRITLALSLALGPLLAGALKRFEFDVGFIRITGIPVILFVAGVVTAVVGVIAYRQLDDHPRVSLTADLFRLLRTWTLRDVPGHAHPGVFIAFEGGEGSGKSTQAERLVAWLEREGIEVTPTREPGATSLGVELRRLLLDPATGPIGGRAETLLYVADRAQHIDEVVRPALKRGGWVISDRYADSTIAYQGAGRGLPENELRELTRIAVDGIRPDLTILLDIDPVIGLQRAGAEPDRMEAEPVEFHQRVRRSFLDQAARQPSHYLIVDAAASPADVARQVRERVEELLETWRKTAVAPAEPAAAGVPG